MCEGPAKSVLFRFKQLHHLKAVDGDPGRQSAAKTLREVGIDLRQVPWRLTENNWGWVCLVPNQQTGEISEGLACGFCDLLVDWSMEFFCHFPWSLTNTSDPRKRRQTWKNGVSEHVTNDRKRFCAKVDKWSDSSNNDTNPEMVITTNNLHNW